MSHRSLRYALLQNYHLHEIQPLRGVHRKSSASRTQHQTSSRYQIISCRTPRSCTYPDRTVSHTHPKTAIPFLSRATHDTARASARLPIRSRFCLAYPYFQYTPCNRSRPRNNTSKLSSSLGNSCYTPIKNPPRYRGGFLMDRKATRSSFYQSDQVLPSALPSIRQPLWPVA
ncbi:hypothetical protein D3C86_1478350 [compost metagenome]